MPLRAIPARIGLDFPHALLRSLGAHGAAEFFRLTSGESRDRHRHLQELLLEERNAESALQNRFQAGMHVDWFVRPMRRRR